MLLKHSSDIRTALAALNVYSTPRDERFWYPWHIFKEMTLLVHGLLRDPAVFQSFGYEDLHKQGYLSFRDWRAFVRIKVENDISLLKKVFPDDDEQNLWSAEDTYSQLRLSRMMIDGCLSKGPEYPVRLYKTKEEHPLRNWDAYDLLLRQQASERLRQTRRAFGREHAAVGQAVCGSSVSSPLRSRLDLKCRTGKAWRTGLQVMKNLCDGLLPHSANDLIMFLAVARAMSRVMSGAQPAAWDRAFNHDLGRWQLVFTNNTDNGSEADAFREAAKAIWGVYVDHLSAVDPDTEVLKEFQDLALNLLSHSGQWLNELDSRGSGLLETQAAWRFRMSNKIRERTSRPTDGVLAHGSVDLSDPSPSTDSQDSSSSLLPSASPPSHHDSALRDAMQSSMFAKEKLVVISLMAGAIFLAVMSFLSGMSLIPSSCGCNGV